MNALPQPKTHQIVDRINAMQAASARFIDPSEVTPLSREWRAIKPDIDQLMNVDACAAWELTGSWRALAGDVEGSETAFRNSVALGQTSVNCENWLIARLNLGLFAEAQALFGELMDRRSGDVASIARYGFLAGAIGRTARVVRGSEVEGDWVADVLEARSIMSKVDVTDEQVAQRLDCGGRVLRRHGFRSVIVPSVISVEGIWEVVRYRLLVPLTWGQARDMDDEVTLEEDKLGNIESIALAVWIKGTLV